MLYDQNSKQYKRHLLSWLELRRRKWKALRQKAEQDAEWLEWLLKHGPKIEGAMTKMAVLAYPRLQAAFRKLRRLVAQQLRLRRGGSFCTDEKYYALVDCMLGLWYVKVRGAVQQWNEATHVKLSSFICEVHTLRGKGESSAYST